MQFNAKNMVAEEWTVQKKQGMQHLNIRAPSQRKCRLCFAPPPLRDNVKNELPISRNGPHILPEKTILVEEEYQIVKNEREYHGCGEEYNVEQKEGGSNIIFSIISRLSERILSEKDGEGYENFGEVNQDFIIMGMGKGLGNFIHPWSKGWRIVWSNPQS